MRARPQIAAISLFVLAAIHTWWGLKMLLASELLIAGSQLVSVGGLLLAGVAAGHSSRAGMATGFGIAALATLPRVLAGLGSPFVGASSALALGLALAAWGAWRIEARTDVVGAVALRSGAVVMALAYATFLALAIALGGGPSLGSIEFVARILAALAFALTVDAPALVRERKAFSGEGASAAR